MQIWNEIKQSFHKGTIITQLIYVNIVVFILLRLLGTLGTIAFPNFTSSLLLDWIAFPASIPMFVHRIWTIFTYQFTHYDFIHLAVNMLWLYWFGTFFLSYYSYRQVLSVYLLGGLFGALLYMLSFNYLPYYQSGIVGSNMIGASASILALVAASATATPNQEVRLMLIGQIKLKYLAIASIVIDLLSVTSSNAGGHIAHLGGALGGYLFAMFYLNKNKDISLWISKLLDIIMTLFKPRKTRRPKMKARHTSASKQSDWEYNKNKKQKGRELDRILDKIKTSGYESLSKSEKEELFKASK